MAPGTSVSTDPRLTSNKAKAYSTAAMETYTWEIFKITYFKAKEFTSFILAQYIKVGLRTILRTD
jgi:hypothetical protein